MARDPDAVLARRTGGRAWLRCFAHEGIEPLRLWYEDIAEVLAGAVAAALRHIGLPLASSDELSAPTRRQADELSDAWVERYERERVALCTASK